MAQQELGVTGSYMILTMLIMSLMSTGSGEVMAVSSIIVYDVYQTHIRPFRSVYFDRFKFSPTPVWLVLSGTVDVYTSDWSGGKREGRE